MILPIFLALLLVTAPPALAGGLACATPHDAGCHTPDGGAVGGGASVGPARTVESLALPPGDGRSASDAYAAALLHLWRDAANGTCLGALGAWHLTPRQIIAEGIAYEIVSFGGSASQIGVGARRISDRAPTTFVFMPMGRDRVDVTGDVIGAPRRFNAALYRCARRGEGWWQRSRTGF